jgi:hypothetical protein
MHVPVLEEHGPSATWRSSAACARRRQPWTKPREAEARGSDVYAFLSLIVRPTKVRRNRLGRSGSACICTCKWAAAEREARWPVFGPAEWNAGKGFNIAQHCKPHRRQRRLLPSYLHSLLRIFFLLFYK